MIAEFRIAFKDLNTAKEIMKSKESFGYRNVSLTEVDNFYCVNFDRKGSN